ncbi:pentatricopeptide repeat-containing protein At3g60050-like [Papaver somniferum]|nr:pentatricopeptide repeat-containing protein At3g60050-like [Papaver somniferum]
MSSMVLFGRRISLRFSDYRCISRFICDDSSFRNNGYKDGVFRDEEFNKKNSVFGFDSDGNDIVEEILLGVPPSSNEDEETDGEYFLSKRRLLPDYVSDTDRVFKILQQDGIGFNTILELNNLGLNVSNNLVREVLLRILKSVNHTNKLRCARLAYKFFRWSAQQENYRHTTNAYHLAMKIFADCQVLNVMKKVYYEMTENNYQITARTFNILISACGEVRSARSTIESFIKSENFHHRPFKHSFNAILHSLLVMNQYQLIEWVYKEKRNGFPPDILTYNILLCTKYRLENFDQFYALLEEMGRNGFVPDLHTYNILLHVCAKANKPVSVLQQLNDMRNAGCDPSVLHFTSIIDGFGRAGNLFACEHFLEEMVKTGCLPDVVCYTVLIRVYIEAGDLEKAQDKFDEMFVKGQLPNVFTYSTMIRGLCIAEKFDKAHTMLQEMESRGCNPNFVVYSTLVYHMRKAGRLTEADEIIRQMVEKGRYTHHLSEFKMYKYRR